MASEKYSSNRAIASGVGNMSSIGFVLSSREIGLWSPPALQELCMHCFSEVVSFSRESRWILDEATCNIWYDLEWGITDNVYFLNGILQWKLKAVKSMFFILLLNFTWSIWILSSSAKTRTRCKEAGPDFQHGRHFLVEYTCVHSWATRNEM